MNCADFEVLFADYLDGNLDTQARTSVEEHIATCATCAAFAQDVRSAVEFIGHAETVEPPPELLTRIAFEIPRGREVKGWRAMLTPWLHPILQPRFAMGMAMTILSFSMLGRFAGIEVRQLTPADLQPTRIWSALDDKMHRAWERGVKYYENLKLVYEVQTRLQEWTEQEEEDRKSPRTGARPAGSAKASEGGERKELK